MSTAPGWEKWAEWNERQHRDVIAWFTAPLEADMTLLDIASGVGQPALAAAKRVKHVIATDVAADMLAGLERRARAAGVTNIELRELDMHDLRGIPDASVDAVTLAFALMFSGQPATALREAHRVLKPGGHFAVCVWDEPARNPFFTTMFGAVRDVMQMPAPAPGAPGPFALSEPGHLERLLREAGFAHIDVTAKPFDFEFDSVDQHWEINTALAAPLKRAAESLPPEQVRKLRDALAQALAPFMVGSRVRVPATPLCASART
ncbi:MAG TPA: methyltransferase domain-containing protein [Kofleriaceae bacterium]|jgi:SAM-dependent methyltransferase|nr:methyltransferase domain-containing protein [Kofleriaceae bacterium]